MGRSKQCHAQNISTVLGPPDPLPLNGAVIFGHSKKSSLDWKSKIGLVPIVAEPPKPQLQPLSTRQSDSGLEAGLNDLVDGEASGDEPGSGHESGKGNSVKKAFHL